MAAPGVGVPGAVARRRRFDTDVGAAPFGALGLGAHLGLQRRHLGEQRLLLLRHLLGFVALAEVRGAHERVRPGPRSGCRTAMICPKSSTWMWWHVLITRPMSCSTSRIARPVAASSMSSSASSSVSDSLRPDDGSSSSSTRGLVASARAISTSRCVPVGAVDPLVGDRREADALDQLVGELTGLELLA